MINLLFITLISYSYILNSAQCTIFQSTLGHLKPQATLQTQTDAVKDLIKRIIPERAEDFIVSVNGVTRDDELELFTLEKLPNGTVTITGSTGVAVASGFNYYLKYYCNSHISWETTQVTLPENLPEVNVTIPFNDRFRYYQNVCTTSYSFVWWNWPQWEKHIDWIVLNSYNLVLAFNGQEAIWERVYKKLNLTQDNIDQHFSGPAFLSWLRMGNMRGFAGPLTSSWHERSLALQKEIVVRMRNFGVLTVLPGFAGHLPRAFKELYPDVNMTQMGAWNHFNDTYCCPYFLEPTENLFSIVGKLFIEEQISEYGTDHVYNADSFNENRPVSSDLTYLSNVGKSIYAAMTAADPQAIWLMQGWLFVHDFFYWTNKRAKALLTSIPKGWMFLDDGFWDDLDLVESFLTSVPLGKMIVLDLQSEQFPQYERLNQYFGQPYIWCMLHNFGGNLGLFGSSDIINEEPIRARKLENSTMIGTGITPEGINQNYVIYDLMSEMAWRSESVNLTEWFANYVSRRYGVGDNKAVQGWEILRQTVYNYKDLIKIRGQYTIVKTPSLKIDNFRWYDFGQLLQAWDLLIQASNTSSENPGYLHDLVDVTRQCLQIYGDIYYNKIKDAYNNNDTASLQDTSEIFLRIFDDLELILASNKAFLLGPWLEDAKNAADTPEDQILFEYNARNQITLWGPDGQIMNYANKQWSGLATDFFGARWTLFLNYTNQVLINSGEPFNETYIKNRMFDEIEEPFTFNRNEYPTEPTGDSVEIARDIFNRWWARSRQENIHHRQDKTNIEGEGKTFFMPRKNQYNPEPNVKQLL